MTKYIQAVLSVVLLLTLSGCYTVVQPGHVGIKVNLSGGEKGVQDLPLTTGRVFYNPLTETVLDYPTFVRTVSWTKTKDEGHPTDESITFTTKDQLAVNADISLSYSIMSARVPSFYVKFRNDDLDQFTHGFLRNVARDQFNETAGKYSIEQIMGDNEDFIKTVRERVQKEVESVGVKIEQFGFIGAARPPDAVIAAINQKIQATQDAIKVENQVRQTQAEAAKNIAKAEGDAKATIARAEGEAKANQLRAQSITANILEWERLSATREAIAKWNGAPSMINGSGGSPTNFLFQIPQGK